MPSLAHLKVTDRPLLTSTATSILFPDKRNARTFYWPRAALVAAQTPVQLVIVLLTIWPHLKHVELASWESGRTTPTAEASRVVLHHMRNMGSANQQAFICAAQMRERTHLAADFTIARGDRSAFDRLAAFAAFGQVTLCVAVAAKQLAVA